MKRQLAVFSALALAATAPGASAVTSIDGTYRDSDGFVEITVAPCGNARCGTITRIIRRKPGEPMNDAHNDNPALRSRPILGVTLLQRLSWRDGAWRGQVYNPEDGGTYRAVVRPAAGGALEVQGCLSIICRTRIWPKAA
ncbi:DUF2147 domain-containing protein [Alteraurantiacibacter aestuarii]|uniref:DUF2147 domain-containing protein n=1 Tax=Alteraurantiacibacter aestuarii TaxID=650004 RepID=A0A844ZPB5_9SPHN|nr:DUF2147 domain-containing protein [Alteraurantiacibacter aestuarii]MXO89182.1 DUF2147 domain-containing protein [Alteraurantiacibacter aestuarii]